MLFAGVVSATSINGDYNGKPIVKVKSDGKELTVEDAPAVIMDGRTMVPISMLRQIGADVTWDQTTYSVNVAINSISEPDESTEDKIKRLNNSARLFNGKYFKVIYDSLGAYAQVRIDGTEDMSKDISDIHALSLLVIGTDASEIVIQYFFDNKFFQDYIVKTSDISDFLNKKIDYGQLLAKWTLKDYKDNTGQSVENTVQPTTAYPELYSNDGKTYLGKLTSDKYDSESVFNTYGTYGSEYSVDSIWNTYGTYGSKYSADSAFNDYAIDPPIIILNGEIVGYLTANKYASGAISPYELLLWLEDNGY